MKSWLFAVTLGCCGLSACVLSREGIPPSGETGGTSGSGTVSSGGYDVCGDGSAECVPAVDSGSYVRVKAGDETCPPGWGQAMLLYEDVDPGCADCTCGTPAGGSCTPTTVQRFGYDDCNGESGSVTNVNDGDCVDVSSGASGYAVGPTDPVGGSCAPSPGTRNELTRFTACSAAGGTQGCGADEVCVPANANGFGEVCVLVAGGMLCPTGYPTATTVFSSITDMRECSCECGEPSSASCAGAEVTLHSDNDCNSGVLTSIPAGTSCEDVSAHSNISSYSVEAGTWQAGACSPMDVVKGNVTFADELVLCCP